MPEREIITTSDRPDLDEQSRAALLPVWPEFIFHDQVSSHLMGQVAECFPSCDIRILHDGEVIAGSWGVPLRWDGTPGTLPAGYDEALISAVTGYEQDVPPDTLCVMAVAVRADRQGAGLGGQAQARGHPGHSFRRRAARPGKVRHLRQRHGHRRRRRPAGRVTRLRSLGRRQARRPGQARRLHQRGTRACLRRAQRESHRDVPVLHLIRARPRAWRSPARPRDRHRLAR